MTLYLIRHARAGQRSTYGGGDGERPLTDAGRTQARTLVEMLDGEPIERILTSPALRCRETVTPLGARRGLQVEVEPRLLEGSSLGGVEELVSELGSTHAVLCSHGDLIPAWIAQLPVQADSSRCGKASIWRVEHDRERWTVSYEPPPDPDDDPLRLGVMDLGSTSFHLLVADLATDGALVRVARKREMLRLGAILPEQGEIPDDVVERVHATARRLRDVARKAGAESLYCVATAAFRDGRHGRSLATDLAADLSTPVSILTGEQEARAIFAAFRRRIGLGSRPVIGLDLGGGSLEVAVGDAGSVSFETTLPLGTVRLHCRHARGDTECDVQAVRQDVQKELEPLVERLCDPAVDGCIATGGTARALGRLVLARRGAPESELCGLVLSTDELCALRDQLARATHAERLAMPGMSEERADLLPAGAAILACVLETSGKSGLTICDWGLREGVLLTVRCEAQRAKRAVYSAPLA